MYMWLIQFFLIVLTENKKSIADAGVAQQQTLKSGLERDGKV